MDGLTERTALDTIRDLVFKSAPLLGTVLGSPLAGVGISLLGGLFGVDTRNTQAIIDKLNSTPDVDAKLKEMEYQHRQVLLQISAQNYQTEVDDRKSARQREMTINDRIPSFLAVAFLFIYAGIQCYVVFTPGSQDDIISARVQDILVMIISYYFGSSHKEKPTQ